MSGLRFSILHRPDRDLIRVRIWEGGELMADSGDLLDTHTGSLKGGRLGVYCDSQDNVKWSALRYRWPSNTATQLQNFAFSGASRASRLIFAT